MFSIKQQVPRFQQQRGLLLRLQATHDRTCLQFYASSILRLQKTSLCAIIKIFKAMQNEREINTPMPTNAQICGFDKRKLSICTAILQHMSVLRQEVQAAPATLLWAGIPGASGAQSYVP